MGIHRERFARRPRRTLLKNLEGKGTSHVRSMMDPAHPETSDGDREGTLTMGTVITRYEGAHDAEKKTLTMSARFTDPLDASR